MGEPRVHDALVGRVGERDAVLALVADAVAGEGGATVVTGLAGVGKTALLDPVAELARSEGVAVARASGTRAESDWPFAGVNLLYSAIRGAVRSSEGAASGTAAGTSWASGSAAAEPLVPNGPEYPSAYEVALTAQALVGRVQAPLLIVLDDAHLMDVPSREVVGFLARRLRSVPVALVLVVGEATLSSPPFAGLPSVRLPELGPDEAAELVRRASGGRLATDVGARLVAGVGGNPRALLDVLDQLSDDQRQGRVELGRYLPHTARLSAMVLPDLATLDESERFALLVAAQSEDWQFAPVVTALEGLPDTVVPWLAHRYLTVLDGTFHFQRPAVQSVIWHTAGLDERSQAHRALAEAYAGRDREYELWHRAHATHEYDAALAVDLHRLAAEVQARGELDRSVAFARHSVRLAADTVDRVDRLVLSCQLALHAGRLDAAVRYARERLRFSATQEQRADLALLEAQASNLDDGHVAVGLISVSADEVAPVDPDRAARLHLLAGRQRAERLEMEAARQHLDAAERFRVGFGTTTLGFARSLRAWLAAVSGEGEAVALDEMTTPAEDADFDGAYLSLSRAQALVQAERYDDARTLLNVIVRDRRYGGSPVLLGSAHVVLADLEMRTGRVVAAAEAALAAERATGREWGVSGRIAASLVRTAALLGEGDEVRARRDQAFAWSQRTGEPGVAAAAHAGAGLHLLMVDRHGEAAAVLERARHHAVAFANPGLLMTEPDLIEACSRLGDTERARLLLDEFEQRVRRCPSAWGRTALARSRALVAEGPDSLSLFREAVDVCGEGPSPVELGRSLYGYGERLHRLGRRAEARTWLDRAAVVFDECGAKAMLARAVRALGAVDPGAADAGQGGAALTAAELRVASLAAGGLRNREIAAQLYVSTRTVEGHLGQVFRKLGIRSRTELAGVARQLSASGESSD